MAGENGLRQGVGPYDLQVGASATGDRGAGEEG